MRRLSSRLDDANAMLSKCNIEHSKALEAYEAQVAQWREEAMYLREKMSGIDAEHQQVRGAGAILLLFFRNRQVSSECGRSSPYVVWSVWYVVRSVSVCVCLLKGPHACSQRKNLGKPGRQPSARSAAIHCGGSAAAGRCHVEDRGAAAD